jgi:hypothetical protein
MKITSKRVLLVALAASLAGVTARAVMSDGGPRAAFTTQEEEIQYQTWTWQEPRQPGGHPLAYYRFQVWLVEDGLYREGTTTSTQVTVDFDRKVLGGKYVYLRVEWVSKKGRVTPIGDSPHLLIQPLPAPPPPDTVPNPFGYDSTATVSFISQWAEESKVDGRLQVTMTAIGAKIELCKVVWYGTRMAPFPDSVSFTIITPNPPIRDIGPSERGNHCRWFEAIFPDLDLGQLGVRTIRIAE